MPEALEKISQGLISYRVLDTNIEPTAAKAVEGVIEVPLFSYAHFQAIRVGTSKAPAHFVSLALLQESGGKER